MSTWTMAMKLVCVNEITQLRIKTTPEHQQNEYWVSEWLKTCASTSDLPPDQKLANQRRWIDSDNASVGVIPLDTANSCLALAVFEKSGRVDDSNTMHLLAHFTPLASLPWQWSSPSEQSTGQPSSGGCSLPTILSSPRTVRVHSSVPGRLPTTVGHRLLHSGIMAVMDFVHLSLAGKQYPINKRLDYGVCFRTLVSEVAGMAAGARQHELGARQWDDEGRQAVERSVVGQVGSAGLHQLGG